MKIRTPILYDKDQNVLCWFEEEIPAELIAQIKWGWAHTVKNCKKSFRTPIVEEKEED